MQTLHPLAMFLLQMSTKKYLKVLLTKNIKLTYFCNFLCKALLTLEDEKLEDLDAIVDKYLKPYSPKNTKPKSPARAAYSAKQKEKVNNQIRKLLSDQGVKDIIDNSISREEAQRAISKFLNK